MTYTFTHAGRWARLRAPLLALAVLAGGCDSADQLATTDPSVQMDAATLDSVVTDSLSTDSTVALDSTALADSLALSDSLAADETLESADLLAEINASEAAVRSRGVPFGPYGLWDGPTKLKSQKVNFTGSLNYTDARSIVRQLSAARSHNQRLILAMTGGGHEVYKTRGKFDMGKWKRRMDSFNRREIKAAVAKGVRDGTIVMNNIMDEPNVKSWGGVMTKARLDEMARYVKRIFPTLPVGVAVVHTWRPQERFRVVDAIITQYSWYMGNINAYRDQALREGRRQGVAVAFSVNLLNGGVQSWKTKKCPAGITGGKGTRAPACRMTANQVRDWGRTLGKAGCSMLMWRYDNAFMSKAANIQALKEVAATLAQTSGRSCRRG